MYDNLEYILNVLKEENFMPGFAEWWKETHFSPLGARLESSSRCNSNCLHCPRELMTRSQIEMTREIFLKCVDSLTLAPRHVHYLFLHLNGEPLLLDIDELCWRINYAKEKLPNTVITFFTNGQLLTEEVSLKLIGTRLDKLSISFNGGTKEDYENIMKGLSFETVYNNIIKFVELNNEKIETATMLLPQKANEHSIAKYFELFKGKGIDDVGGAGINNIGGTIDAKHMRLDGQYHAGSPNASCWRTFTDVNVMADGRVCACCQDVLGNIIHGSVSTDPLLDIWHGDSLTRLREEFLRGNHPNLSSEFEMCNKCDFMESLAPGYKWWR